MSGVVITGADGQLGRAFRRIWPEAIFLARKELDLGGNLNDIHQAILDLKPDTVIHCAAMTAVDQAETPGIDLMAMWANGAAVLPIAMACAEVRPQGAHLVQISTDYVYGPVRNPDYQRTEQRSHKDIPHPESIYGWSKLLGEAAAMYTWGLTGAHPPTIVRTSWVFGEGKNFVNTILALAKQRIEAAAAGAVPEKLEIVGDQVGRPTYALDLARAIKQLLEKHPGRPPQRVYNIQNSGPAASWADFARETLRLSHAAVPVTGVKTDRAKYPAPRPNRSTLDITPMQAEGIELRDWRDALTAYLVTLGFDPPRQYKLPSA